jgi:hypothetical protein
MILRVGERGRHAADCMKARREILRPESASGSLAGLGLNALKMLGML